MSSPFDIIETAPLSVLIIADKGVIDTHLTAALSNVADIELIGHHTSGIDGVSAFRKRHIDVIIIDIGMEDEDPLLTLKRLLRIDKHAKIIMASTLSFSNVRQSMMGFERGAAEFINTPATFTQKSSAAEFKAEVLRVVRSLAQARRQENPRTAPPALLSPSPPTEEITLRRGSAERPQILAIGSSTGGPQALLTVFEGLADNFPVPILVTQHMPKTFTAVLANTISSRTNKTAVEAKEGMRISPGTIYIAPGDFHMTLTGSRAAPVISLNQDPQVNYCRPSVDPMVESIVAMYGAHTLLTILTGMGTDGKNSAESVVKAGGTVIAQDFATSTVWGMPRAVSVAGLCTQVLALGEVSVELNRYFSV